MKKAISKKVEATTVTKPAVVEFIPETQVEAEVVVSPEALVEAVEKIEASKREGVQYLRVSTDLGNGFWRAKRHFTKTPVDLLVSELTTAEMNLLVTTNPRFLNIELITK